MRAVICKGDRTSHGGRVLEGNPNVTTGGKQIAQLGHSTICPLCKGKFPIIEGVPSHTYGGKPTAVHGMKTACGATLIASQNEFLIDAGGGSPPKAPANQTNPSKNGAVTSASHNSNVTEYVTEENEELCRMPGYGSPAWLRTATTEQLAAYYKNLRNPHAVPWDGLVRQSPAQTYVKNANGGLDSVRANNWHFQVAKSLPEAAMNEAGGLALSKAVKFAGAKILGQTSALTPKVTYVDPHDALRIINTPKGLRPLPETYMSQQMLDAHAALFSNGAARIGPSVPTGTIGRTETWVMPQFVAEKAIAEAAGDVAKLERLLGFDRGYLGKAPVLIRISNPMRVRMPSGREFGANNLWNPGGYTNGGLPEAIIDAVPSGRYVTTPISVGP